MIVDAAQMVMADVRHGSNAQGGGGKGGKVGERSGSGPDAPRCVRVCFGTLLC